MKKKSHFYPFASQPEDCVENTVLRFSIDPIKIVELIPKQNSKIGSQTKSFKVFLLYEEQNVVKICL